MTHFNIAIDGPAGAGKSTIAKMLAARLGFVYVDTGAMYRAMALFFLRRGIAPEDEAAVSNASAEAEVTIRYEDGSQKVFLNGEDVSTEIRKEEVGNMASATSIYLPVRKKLVELQQNLAASADVIMDGRDIGTCVLPHAQVKIYLTASSAVRAKRRYNELTEKGQTCDLAEIEKDIIDRDYRDMHREQSPLKQADDAVLIDSSHMTIDQVVDAMISLAQDKGLRTVTVAKTAGFCFGVERAVDQVYEQIRLGKSPIYTFGPIIHNEEVVRDLEEKGVHVLETEDELRALKEGTVIIRSHGVSRRIYEILEQNHLEVIDATCPFVKKIHRIVEEQTAAGNQVVIIGNGTHPEVEGIRGWGDSSATVLESLEEADNFVPKTGCKLCVVAQTTFNYKKFKELVEKISKKGYDILVLNTICNATQERQVEAKEIASKVDAMIVIGGKNSSNTQKLYEICLKECKNTFYIQTLGDFDPESVNSVRSVGITAGASTPKKIIEEVHTNVRIKF